MSRVSEEPVLPTFKRRVRIPEDPMQKKRIMLVALAFVVQVV
ncbi:MAG: hypothetical protein ABSD75_05185 [Terriglobales bacterium]|jgi:hypothetical protein